MKIYRKIDKVRDILDYFVDKEWTFVNDRLIELWGTMDTRDKQLFNFDIHQLSWEQFSQAHCLGLRVYLVKDDIHTLPSARKKWKKWVAKKSARVENSPWWKMIVFYFDFFLISNSILSTWINATMKTVVSVIVTGREHKDYGFFSTCKLSSLLFTITHIVLFCRLCRLAVAHNILLLCVYAFLAWCAWTVGFLLFKLSGHA